jgi:hydroxymethylbilane synthase
LVHLLNDEATRQAVLAERALLAALRGGCLAPVGAWARLDSGGALCLDAIVLSPDGRRRIAAAGTAPPHESEILGRNVASQLIDQGASELLFEARHRDE